MTGFRNRDFAELNELLAKNELLENSFFQTVVQMSKLHSDILKSCTVASAVHKTLNKSSQFLTNLCDDDKVPTINKINCEIIDYKPIKLGQSRE